MEKKVKKKTTLGKQVSKITEDLAGDGTGTVPSEVAEVKTDSLKVFDSKQETIKRNRLTTADRARSNKMRKRGFCLDKEELNDVS